MVTRMELFQRTSSNVWDHSTKKRQFQPPGRVTTLDSQIWMFLSNVRFIWKEELSQINAFDLYNGG